MNRGWRSIVFPFYGDLDQSTEKKITATSMGGGVSGMFDRMVNLRIDKTGRIVKRYGHEVIALDELVSGDEQPGGIHRLHDVGDELVAYADNGVFSVLKGLEGETVAMGPPLSATLEREPLARNLTSVRTADSVVSNGFLVIIYFRGVTSLRSRVIEVATGALVRDEEVISNGVDTVGRYELVAGTDCVVAFWSVNADTEINYRVLPTTSSISDGWGTETVLVSDCSNNAFDVTRSGTADNPTWIVAYNKNDGTNYLRVNEYDDDFSAGDHYEAAHATLRNVAIHGEIGEKNVWLSTLDDTNGWRALCLDQDMTGVLSATTLANPIGNPTFGLSIVAAPGSDTAFVFRHHTAGFQNYTGDLRGVTVDTSGTVGTLKSWNGATTYARPYVVDGQIYLPVRLGFQTLVEETIGAVLHVNDGNTLRTQLLPIAFYARGLLTNYVSLGRDAVPRSSILGDGKVSWCAVIDDYSSRFGIDRVILDHSGTRGALGDLSSGVLYTGGSIVGQYDRSQGIQELGCALSVPILSTDAVISSTGGSIEQGSYQYVFVPEWIDGAGKLHYGPPSDVMDADLSLPAFSGNTGSVQWDVPNIVWTRNTSMRIALYRTKKGPGPVFYRVGSVSNDPTGAAGSITDENTDDDIAVNPVLYLSAGELIHEFPPPTRHLVVHDQRLAGIDAENPGRIWLTAPMSPLDGPWHNSTFQIFVDSRRLLTALASVDGKLYAFTESEIFLAMYGPGPERNGSGAPFPTPQLLTTQAGCSEVRSLIVGPDGIYFAGPAHPGVAIYKWMRGDTGLVTLSDKVRDDLDEYPVITSATHVRDQSQIRWTCRNTDGDDGRVLVYDYSRPDANGVGAWSVYKLTDSSGVAMFQTATTWNGQWTAARSDVDGELWLEETDRHDDDGQFVGTELRTAYLWPAGPMSPCYVKSITVMGEYLGPCVLNITLENGPDTDEQTSFTLSGTAGDDVFKQWQIRQRKRGRGYVRWTFTETVSGSSVDSAGVALNAIQMQWTPLSGPLRLGAGDRR